MTKSLERARSARLDEIKTKLRTIQIEAARHLWEFGALFAEVQRDELWRDDGSASFAEWVQDEMGVSPSTASKAIGIAANFSADMAERFGSEKLNSTVRYLEATHKEERPGDVLALRFRLRNAGRFVTVPFVDATYREIEAARELVLAARVPKRPEPAKDVTAKVHRLVEALPAALPGTARGERVRLTSSKDGRLAVSFNAIPLDEIPAFLDTVKAHLLENGEPNVLV